MNSLPLGGSSDVSGGRSESESSGVHFIISCLSEGACQLYADNIVRIQYISAGMTRQLVADIGEFVLYGPLCALSLVTNRFLNPPSISI